MAEAILKLKVDAGKDELYVYDNTGKYSTQNQGGWGNPNTLISDVVSAEIRVYLPKSESYTSIDVYPSLPSDVGLGFEIDASDLGLSSLDPGIYKLQYIVTTNTSVVIESNVFKFFHYLPIECCISSKKLVLQPTDATSDMVNSVLEMELLLENAIWSACAGDDVTAEEISDSLWLKCSCCC
jgi:hypothetical protein